MYIFVFQVIDFGDVFVFVVDDLLLDGMVFVSYGMFVVGGMMILIILIVVFNLDGMIDVFYDVGVVVGNIVVSIVIFLSYIVDILQSYMSSDGGGLGFVCVCD